jgi:hypothetical protein
LSGASEPEPLSLNDKWKWEKAVEKEATNIIGYARKQAGKEWFDGECENVNAIHRKTRAAKDKYRQAQSDERKLFKEKSRQHDKEALIEIERHRNIQDAHIFYKRLNDVKRPFKAKNGELLTKQALERIADQDQLMVFREHRPNTL